MVNYGHTFVPFCRNRSAAKRCSLLLANWPGFAVKLDRVDALHRGSQMEYLFLEIAGAIALLVAAGVLLRKPLRAWRQAHEADRGRRDFRPQREVLEARFFDLAAASGKPR